MVSLGIGTGFERSYHVLKRLGTTPLGRPRLIAAKIGSVIAVEIVQFAVLIPVAYALGWDPGSPNWLLAVAGVVIGTVAFAGIGLTLAGRLPGEINLAAQNGLYLVLLLLGGMVIPFAKLPDAGSFRCPRLAVGRARRPAARRPRQCGHAADTFVGRARHLGDRGARRSGSPVPLGLDRHRARSWPGSRPSCRALRRPTTSSGRWAPTNCRPVPTSTGTTQTSRDARRGSKRAAMTVSVVATAACPDGNPRPLCWLPVTNTSASTSAGRPRLTTRLTSLHSAHTAVPSIASASAAARFFGNARAAVTGTAPRLPACITTQAGRCNSGRCLLMKRKTCSSPALTLPSRARRARTRNAMGLATATTRRTFTGTPCAAGTTTRPNPGAPAASTSPIDR